MSSQLEIIITKAAAVFAAAFYTTGSILTTVDLGLGILFKVLSCVSILLIIAVNWDNGTTRIKKALKRKENK